jgi:hypothetical protein
VVTRAHLIALAIGLATLGAGLTTLVRPAAARGLLGLAESAGATYALRIGGMMMAAFGLVLILFVATFLAMPEIGLAILGALFVAEGAYLFLTAEKRAEKGRARLQSGAEFGEGPEHIVASSTFYRRLGAGFIVFGGLIVVASFLFGLPTIDISTAGALFLLAVGWRWAFRAELVVANPNNRLSDPQPVRRFGFVMIAIGLSVLLVNLLAFHSE